MLILVHQKIVTDSRVGTNEKEGGHLHKKLLEAGANYGQYSREPMKSLNRYNSKYDFDGDLGGVVEIRAHRLRSRSP